MIDKILSISPPLEWNNDTFWKKYGYYYFGIGDGYKWNEESLKNEEEHVLWIILATIQSHRAETYDKRYWEQNKQLSLFFDFSWKAREYVPYNKTDFNSHFEYLNVLLDFIKNNYK